MPTDEELTGGIAGYGISNIFCAFFGGLPTATYSQNVGIVSTTKVVSRVVMGLAAAILLAAGLIPKFSSLLTTIPYCVLGGATISVFASITMTGIKLITTEPMDFRNTTVVWTCSSSRNGCDTGKCFTGTVPGMGDNNFRKISGCSCNDCSNCVKFNPSKSKEKRGEIILI